MKKKILAMLILPIAALSFVACGEEKAQEKPADKPVVESEFKDGTYEGETEADEKGGKATASIKVEGGKFVEVKYNESNDEGNKRDNAEYNKMMKEKAGTNPAEFEVAIEKAVTEKQSAEFDAITGATSSSAKAKTLFTEIVKNAKEGNTEKATVAVEAK